MAVSHHDATLNSGNIEHHISGRNLRAPVIHLRRIQGGPLFDTYVECFEKLWVQARQFDPAKGS